MRVIDRGEVGVGDAIEVLSRAEVQQAIREVPFGSLEHAATIELRTKVLRTPLGLTFPPGELESEKSFHHIACYRGSKLAGCLVLRPLADGEIQMKQVAVTPDLQCQGVGRAMVEFSEKLAATLGYRRMTMHARETAVKFYEKYGYEKIGERFMEVTLPHWEMVKSLNGAEPGS
jgi:ribosomal protein S18 acetylase RimI-like enzyme